MKFEKGNEIERYNQFYPNTVVLIGAGNRGGRSIMPSSWHAAISRDPLLYGVMISPKRYTHSLIEKSGEFSINFVGSRMSSLVAQAGGVSGRDVDKFQAFGVPYNPGRVTAAPVLPGAYCVYECEVEAIYPGGDHSIVVGKVLGVHTDEGVFREDGFLKLSDLQVDLYMGASTYLTLGPDAHTRIEK